MAAAAAGHATGAFLKWSGGGGEGRMERLHLIAVSSLFPPSAVSRLLFDGISTGGD